MSAKPDKGKNRQDIDDETKDEPGQSRKPGQQSGQPEQTQQKQQKDDQSGKGHPRSGQR